MPFPPITNDPESYAKYLFVSWQNANQQEGAKVASADAVTQMFSQAYSPQTPYTFGMCGPAAGSVFCTWTAQNGAKITMTVRNLTGGLPIQVVAVAELGSESSLLIAGSFKVRRVTPAGSPSSAANLSTHACAAMRAGMSAGCQPSTSATPRRSSTGRCRRSSRLRL